MRRTRLVTIGVLLAAAVGAIGLGAAAAGRAAAELPARLSDQEFWRLVESLSEPDGAFRSDNVLSNEMVFQHLLPAVVAKAPAGGVYVGVGPEQNFTYIAAMRARMAFIADVRRDNLRLHLVYKALFALAADRADFVARLFTKPRPPGLRADAPVADIFSAFWTAPTAGEQQFDANLADVERYLTRTRGLPLGPEDRDGIRRVYRAFYWYGPAMNYSATLDLGAVGSRNAATYADLMTQTGADGTPLTYLGSEAAFAYVKDLEARNLIVPVVGNFSGPKAIRAIGEYVRGRGATIGAFYVSTVEPYLRRDGSFPVYCASVATLPMTDASVLIRPGNAANLGIGVSGFTGARLGTYQLGVVVPLRSTCD
jgi:hypothetical protein